jgi:small subunit ribosomal protein S2
VTNPPRPSDVTLELLLASQSHLGHATSLWNPANSRYIFGIRDGIHIISLEVTAAHLRRAAKVVTAVAERGGLILFVGTRSGQDRCVVKAAKLAGGCHLFEHWIPGSITNGLQILGRCKLKVVDEFDNEVEGFDQQLIERESLKPDLVVCLNPLENWVLLHECALNNIPTIGIIDTDANPTWVTYPIPANDDR